MRKLALVAAVALGCAVYFVTSASATPPAHNQFTFTFSAPVDDLCPFTIEITPDITIDETTYFDQAGNITRFYDHVDEQDTFTANGKTLTGIAYTTNVEAYFENGVMSHEVASGMIEKVPLPDGGMFLAAGRINPLPPFLFFEPDRGAFKNLDGFCAALSP